MLRLDQIRFDYPAPREGGVAFRLELGSLRIERGESVAIIGPSGCGKTTLLRLASGILVPASGTVELDGRDVGGLSEAERRMIRSRSIGTVFQDFRLLDHLDVIENVVLPFRLGAGRLDRTVRARAEQLLERMGIDRLRRRSVPRLSQGERQRVAICRALVTEPGLVLADEPTGNLDPETAAEVFEHLNHIVRGTDTAALIVTHNEALATTMDRRLTIRDGGIAEI